MDIKNNRFTKPNISAGIRIIFGESRLQGKLPVDIPSAPNPNQIVYPFGFGLDIKNSLEIREEMVRSFRLSTYFFVIVKKKYIVITKLF